MKDKESTIQAIRSSLIGFDEEETIDLLKKGIDDGVNPIKILENGLSSGMKEIGDKFGSGELYLPELMRGAAIMQASVDILTPVIKKAKQATEKSQSYKVILGTVKGDIHDIGKSIVKIIFETAGFEIIDLGVDISTDEFIDAIIEYKPLVLGLSALLTTTLPQMKVVIETIKEKGLRENIIIIVGGSSLSQEYADDIGADAYGIDAVDGLNKVNNFHAHLGTTKQDCKEN